MPKPAHPSGEPLGNKRSAPPPRRPAPSAPFDDAFAEVCAFARALRYHWDFDHPEASHVDEGLEILTGLKPETLATLTPAALEAMIDPRDRDAVRRAAEGALSGATSGNIRFTVEYRFRRGEGDLRWHRLWNLSTRRPDGGWVHHGVIQDVTEQKSVSETLHDIIETAPFPITVTSPREGTLLYANRNALLFYGLDPETRKPIHTPPFYANPEDRKTIVQKILAEGEAGMEIEMRLVNGETRWMSFSAKLFEYEGRPAIMSAQFDITGRKLAEQALQEAHARLEHLVGERTAELIAAKAQLEKDLEDLRKAKEENAALEHKLRQSQVMEAVGLLAGGVAHDFNNLMASILSCLHNTRTRATGNPAFLEEICRMEELCKRGGDLTRRLLTFSRRIPGRQEPIDLRAFLFELRQLLERTLPKQIRLEVALPERLPLIRADRSMLTAALLNLVTNARDAMPQGGELSISAYEEASGKGAPEVVARIADTGEGIPEDIRERVFEPFFTTKPVGQGTGLGLSTVFAFMKDCGGDVSVQSSGERGTAFTLRFPSCVAQRGEETTLAKSPATLHPLTQEPILVVEDEDTILEFTQTILRESGYRTLSARTGLDALEILGKPGRRVGLVTLDLMMPRLGGDKVFRILRSLAPELPVLFLTGRPDLAYALHPGATVLPKPFTRESLLEAVAEALDPLRKSGGEPSADAGKPDTERVF